MKSIKTILGQIRQADQKYSLFQENDRIMLGVSGGKDSMVMAYAMLIYQKFNFVKFEVVPCILDLGFPDFDAKPIEEFFKSLGSELKVVDSKDVYQILKAHQKEDKNLPCSICSRMKKAAINKAAHELGCNKVAFAHHADDAIETLFLNEIYGGRIATFQPKMHLERTNIDFIRPLILTRESEIMACQKEEGIPSFSSHCPNDGITMRSEIKELVNSIYKQYPSAKTNFLTMLNNYDKECLFYGDIYYKIERKDISFKPVISANDSLIEAEIRAKKNALTFDKGLRRFIIYKKHKAIGVFSLKSTASHEISIYDFILLKENKLTRSIAFAHLEKELSRKIYPLTIKVFDKENKNFYQEHGYKKTHLSGLSKYFE